MDTCRICNGQTFSGSVHPECIADAAVLDTPKGFTDAEWAAALEWIRREGPSLMEEAEADGGRALEVWVVDRWWDIRNVKRVARLLLEE